MTTDRTSITGTHMEIITEERQMNVDNKQKDGMQWLDWAIRLQSIAQAGLAYSNDKYDLARFEEIRDISAEIVSKYSDTDMMTVRSLFCNETGYQTPKVDVRAVILKGDKILLVKESLDGKWTLPGGWAEVDLSVKENIIKEAREEAGLNVVPNRLLAVLDRNRHNAPAIPYGVYKIFVLCELVDGSFQKNIETLDSGFFNMGHLPELSTGRVTAEQLELCFRLSGNSCLEPVFD